MAAWLPNDRSGMQSTLNAILAQLSGRSSGGGGGGGSSVQASESHVSPASSTSQALSHHSHSIAPQQLAAPVTQQQQQQQTQQALLGGPPPSFSFPAGSSLSFSPSGSLSMGGGIPTSAYSPLNIASPSFSTHLFGSVPQAYSPTPHASGPSAASSSSAPAMFDQSAFNRLSDMRGGWMPSSASLTTAAAGRSSMAPPPLPDFLRRPVNDGGSGGGGGGLAHSSLGQQDAQSGYRADTEDSYGGAGGGGSSRINGGGKRPLKAEGDTSGSSSAGRSTKKKKVFPALPGFAPPESHRFAPYEIVPSTAVSSEGARSRPSLRRLGLPVRADPRSSLAARRRVRGHASARDPLGAVARTRGPCQRRCGSRGRHALPSKVSSALPSLGDLSAD